MPTIKKEDLVYESRYSTWSGYNTRTDNESFVKAWQSSVTIEDFLELTGENEWSSRQRATRMRGKGIRLKYLKKGNASDEHLARLAKEYDCSC